MKNKLDITAYEVVEEPMPIRTAERRRDWIDALPSRFGYRCLPLDGEPSPLVGSHFGHGVLTITLGYLFRTTKAHNLWVKGPANQPKDGIAALEGIIETDWAPYTFTMNWQFTRKRHKVRFEKDEPIATVVPYPRHYIGKFDPVQKNLNENPKLYQQYVQWREDRLKFNKDLVEGDEEAREQGWQRTYMKGEDGAGQVFAGHETKLRIRDFRKG